MSEDYDRVTYAFSNSPCRKGQWVTGFDKKQGAVTAGYQRLKSLGAFIPPNYYHREKLTRNYPQGTVSRWDPHIKELFAPPPNDDIVKGYEITPRWTNDGEEVNLLLCFGSLLVTDRGIAAKAEAQAASNFNASIQNVQTANLGVTMLELKQSMGLVGDTALTLARTYKRLRRGQFSKAVEVLWDKNRLNKDRMTLSNLSAIKRRIGRARSKHATASENAANAWLELQFGWLPLIQDVYDITSTVASQLTNRNPEMLTFHGFGEAKDTDVANNPSVKTEGERKVRVGYHSSYTINSPQLYALNQFGLVNPLSIAWEVVPFSFVADWFLPVGNYLSSLTADAGLKRIGGCRSELFVYNNSGSVIPPADPKNSDIYTASGSEEYFRFTRTVRGTDPSVPLQLVNPLELLDGWHVATSLSLLKKVFF